VIDRWNGDRQVAPTTGIGTAMMDIGIIEIYYESPILRSMATGHKIAVEGQGVKQTVSMIFQFLASSIKTPKPYALSGKTHPFMIR
jgi:hypothetical protein